MFENYFLFLIPDLYVNGDVYFDEFRAAKEKYLLLSTSPTNNTRFGKASQTCNQVIGLYKLYIDRR